jgi:hypothetical protein
MMRFIHTSGLWRHGKANEPPHRAAFKRYSADFA